MVSQVDAEGILIALEQVGVDNGIHHDTPPCSSIGNSPREDSRDGDLPPSKASIRLKLTGYRLWYIICPLVFLIAKEENPRKLKEPWTMTLLDWVQIGLFGTVSFLLSCFEKDNPGRWPYFFEVDLIPPIWDFVCRPDDVARSLLVLISIIPVWMAVVRILLVLDIIQVNRNHITDYPRSRPPSWSLLWQILITAALSLSIAIISLVHRLNMVFFPRHSTTLEKWLPPTAVVFVVTLVVMTTLVTHQEGHIWFDVPFYAGEQLRGTYISDTGTSMVPFRRGRVQYDFPLSMAPVIMMFMVPEPRLRMVYSGLSITMFGLCVWSLYVLRDLHSVLNVSQSIFNLTFMAGVASFTLFEFLRMFY